MKPLLKAVVAAALVASSVGAMAGLSVTSAIPVGLSLLSDNSAEQWIDADGSGDLNVGDSLRGIFSIDNTQPPITNIGVGTSYNELSGIFQTRVKSRTFAFTDGGVDFYDYVFEADPAFAVEFAAKGAIAGTVGIFFEDTTPDFKREVCGPGNTTGTFANCEATATDGSVWGVMAIAGGMWKANNAAAWPDIGANVPLTTPLGTFGFGLNFQVNNTGAMWNKVGCQDPTTLLPSITLADMCGQGGILGTGRDLAPGPGVARSDTPYPIFDNVDFTVNKVPEPGTLAMVGLALAGLGFIGRRSRKG